MATGPGVLHSLRGGQQCFADLKLTQFAMTVPSGTRGLRKSGSRRARCLRGCKYLEMPQLHMIWCYFNNLASVFATAPQAGEIVRIVGSTVPT